MAHELRDVVSQLSLFPIKIIQLCKGEPVGSGTGCIFVSSPRGEHFLVTNWHILTGRQTQNPAELMPNVPDSPDEIRFSLFQSDTNYERTLTLRAPLYDRNSNAARWIEHPRGGCVIDLAALPLVDIPDEAEVISSADLRPTQNMKLEVGMDVFIIGFPYGITGGGGILPVWKKGTIATEPYVLLDDLPKFLVDSSTRLGMSGSPVFSYATGTYRTTDNEVVQSFGPQPPYNFVGVLSAHIGSGNAAKPLPELAVIWHAQAVSEMMGNPRPGQNPFPPNHEP